jgi:hypothetical protein
LTLGYRYTSGDIIPDPSLPIAGVESDIHTAVVGYMQSIELWGRSSNVLVELPYSAGETTVELPENGPVTEDYQGVGDLAVTLSVNFVGAPTMNLEDFAELRRNPRPILGGSLKLVAPTGRYDGDRVLNVGANRWAAKAELGYSHPLTNRWLLELQLGAWVFSDNTDFLGMEKEQDPIASLELHLVRRFKPGFWASLDANLYKGGRTTLDGVRLDDLKRDSKYGAMVAFPVTKRDAVRLAYGTGSVIDSDEHFDVFIVSYTRLF